MWKSVAQFPIEIDLPKILFFKFLIPNQLCLKKTITENLLVKNYQPS